MLYYVYNLTRCSANFSSRLDWLIDTLIFAHFSKDSSVLLWSWRILLAVQTIGPARCKLQTDKNPKCLRLMLVIELSGWSVIARRLHKNEKKRCFVWSYTRGFVFYDSKNIYSRGFPIKNFDATAIVFLRYHTAWLLVGNVEYVPNCFPLVSTM